MPLLPSSSQWVRVLGAAAALWFLKATFFSSKEPVDAGEIVRANMFERITIGTPLGSSQLNPQKYSFLQSRIGRAGKNDLFDMDITAGIEDFWGRYQLPFATAPETFHLDEQVIKSTVEELLGFNGWAAAACTTLTRPYAAKKDDLYSDLATDGRLYYFALVVHSADHFFIDQLATIVQISKKVGPHATFVSVVDYASEDSIPFLSDLAEAVMILLGIPFRIRRVPPMTEDPAASYYPLEEAHTRNLALEPLYELFEKRKVIFTRVIWLKGFTCPNDLLESMRLSLMNSAAMVCSMDWKEHNGFFIYNDRWRTRDLDGNLFRGSRSTSKLDEAPPRHKPSADRYNQHLPFQTFCCESGSHIVDPHKSYYAGIKYRSSVSHVFNISSAEDGKAPTFAEGPCMDSSQMHFCRDLWLSAARDGVKIKAREAAKRQRSGKPRGLSEEMEEIIRAVAPKLAIPGAHPPTSQSDTSDHFEPGMAAGGSDDDVNDKDSQGGHVDGDVTLEDADAHLPQADFDGTDGVGAGRDIDAAAAAANEEAAKGMDPVPGPGVEAIVEEMAGQGVGGKPLPKGQQRKRDVEESVGDPAAADEAKRQDGAALNPQGDGAVAAEVQNLKGDLPTEDKVVPQVPAQADDDKGTTSTDDSGDGNGPQDEIIDGTEGEEDDAEDGPLSSNSAIRNLPNSAFVPAKILVNPRCITTYAGVSHTQLALDLFGAGNDIEPSRAEGGKYHFTEWETAPGAFVCQEMRTTGGRVSSKQQRRTAFSIGKTLRSGWRPGDDGL